MEKIGNYYRLFSMNINGARYYFIGEHDQKGFQLLFKNKKDAIEHFKLLEKARQDLHEMR